VGDRQWKDSLLSHQGIKGGRGGGAGGAEQQRDCWGEKKLNLDVRKRKVMEEGGKGGGTEKNA